jgi:hypothetical protein
MFGKRVEMPARSGEPRRPASTSPVVSATRPRPQATRDLRGGALVIRQMLDHVPKRDHVKLASAKGSAKRRTNDAARHSRRSLATASTAARGPSRSARPASAAASRRPRPREKTHRLAVATHRDVARRCAAARARGPHSRRSRGTRAGSRSSRRREVLHRSPARGRCRPTRTRRIAGSDPGLLSFRCTSCRRPRRSGPLQPSSRSITRGRRFASS